MSAVKSWVYDGLQMLAGQIAESTHEVHRNRVRW